MILLDIAKEAGTGDAALITALISGGGVVGGFLKMVQDKAKMKAEITQLIKDHEKSEKEIKEKLIEVTASKKAMKLELKEEIEKKDQVLHNRIDRVRDDNIRSYEKLEAKIAEVDKKMDDHTKQILAAINKK